MFLNLTHQLKGAKKEQILLHEMFERLRKQFCERVEITPLMMFTHTNTHGIKCQNARDECRYLDLKSMVQHCLGLLKTHTMFWPLDPIIDYATLNVAACLAVYHTSLKTMSDLSLSSHVRAQHCETMVYLNQLLRTHKDGKLYKKVKLKLSKSSRGSQFNRDLMLPLVPHDVLKRVAKMFHIAHHDTMVSPISADNVQQTTNDKRDIVSDRIYWNMEKGNKNRFDTNVLQCVYCKRLFFGGKGQNDIELYQEHLLKNPHHKTTGITTSISNTDWEFEFRSREEELLDKCNTYYSQEQIRAYKAVFNGQKSLMLMGVGGSGKSTLLKDIKYVLQCIFWKKGEISLCGATNAVARERLGITATSFHSFLGVIPMDNVDHKDRWNVTLSHCMACIRTKYKKNDDLKNVRVVILEEGLELSSVLMEAYFRHISESGWKCVTLINGDVCQGSFREDDSSGESEMNLTSETKIWLLMPLDRTGRSIILFQGCATCRTLSVT